MDARTLADIVKHAVERSRKTTLLSTQLLDDDGDIALLMATVAADIINGAVQYLSDDDSTASMTKEEALTQVMKTVISIVGVRRVRNAVRTTKEKP
jgi:hypothetical protein